MKNNNLEIRKTGYGHWKISMEYYGKTISTITTDSVSIDDYNSNDGDKDGRQLRRKRGFTVLKNAIVRQFKNSKNN